MNTLYNISKKYIIIYLLLTIINWFIPRIYILFCVPPNFYGYLQSLILTTSPHCNLLRHSFNLSNYNINYLQTTFISFILELLCKYDYIKKYNENI